MNVIQGQNFYDAGFSWLWYRRQRRARHPLNYMYTFFTNSRMVHGWNLLASDGCRNVCYRGIYTNIGNYDLEYLRSRLGDSFIRPSGTALQRIKEAISEANRGYDQVSIKTEFIGADDHEENLATLELLLGDREAANALWHIVAFKNLDKQEPEYIFSRYVRVLTAWNYFDPKFVHSSVFNAFPKRSNSEFDLNILMTMQKIQSRHPMQRWIPLRCHGHCDRWNFFEKTRTLWNPEIRQRRLYYLHTRQSGQGQNLQYNPESA